LPACTGTGLAALVIERLAESATCTLTEALLLPLFGSVVTLLATEAVSVMVAPEVAVALTFTTNVKVAVALSARLAIVQV